MTPEGREPGDDRERFKSIGIDISLLERLQTALYMQLRCKRKVWARRERGIKPKVNGEGEHHRLVFLQDGVAVHRLQERGTEGANVSP